MMMKNERSRPWLALLILLPALLLPACAHLNRVMESPELRLESIALESLSLSRQTFRVGLVVHNPNEFRLRLARIDYDLSVEGVPLTRGVFDQGLSVPAGGQERLSLSVETDLLATGQGLLEWLRAPGSELAYRIEGEVQPDMFWARALPYRHEGRVELRQP